MSPRQRTSAVATAVAAAAVWIATDALPWPARAWSIVLLVIVPALSIVQATMLERVEEEIPRKAVYISSAAAIWLLGGVSALAAVASGMSGRTLGLVGASPAAVVIWSLAALAAALLVLVLGRALDLRESATLLRVLPRTRPERMAFVLLSISAGVGEELAYRAFLIPALAVATGSTTLAVLLSSAAFGMVHGYQAASGVARAALLGLVLASSFALTGSVLPAMIAHALLDIIAGIWLADWLVRR